MKPRETPHDAAQFITLREAARSLPHRPHPSALWRWCRHGVRTRTPDGVRIVRLAHIRLGGRILVRIADVIEFGRQLAEADVGAREGGRRSERHAMSRPASIPPKLRVGEMKGKQV